jgi:excisionase family DNA binding protein
MPLLIDGTRYYTTTEAASRLGVRPGTVRDAVARGALVARRLDELRRNVIAEEELARYEALHAGRKGWTTRKAPDHEPSPSHLTYHQNWRPRERVAERPPEWPEQDPS